MRRRLNGFCHLSKGWSGAPRFFCFRQCRFRGRFLKKSPSKKWIKSKKEGRSGTSRSPFLVRLGEETRARHDARDGRACRGRACTGELATWRALSRRTRVSHDTKCPSCLCCDPIDDSRGGSSGAWTRRGRWRPPRRTAPLKWPEKWVSRRQIGNECIQ